MQTVETSTLHENNNSFMSSLIIRTFEKRAPEQAEVVAVFVHSLHVRLTLYKTDISQLGST